MINTIYVLTYLDVEAVSCDISKHSSHFIKIVVEHKLADLFGGKGTVPDDDDRKRGRKTVYETNCAHD